MTTVHRDGRAQSLSAEDEQTVKKKDLHDRSTRRNRSRERKLNDRWRDGDHQACDAAVFHCPSCGRAVAGAAEAVQKRERFLKRLFDRQEELQRSLASSIHDDLAQHLTAALFYLEGCQPLRGGVLNDGQENFRTGLKLLGDGIHKARRIAGQLQPLICGDGGVALGIEYLVYEMLSRDGPEIAFQVKGDLERIEPQLASAVFRILRELLTNACRHSGTEEIRLQVTRTEEHLWLGVEDWGTGFDLEKVNGEDFGLQEVQQRAAMLGGAVIVDSTPGKGTRVVVRFPAHEASCAASVDGMKKTKGNISHG